jgi:hypothetical protein
MGNLKSKIPPENQTLRFVRKNYDSPRKLAVMDIKEVTPDGSPRYEVTIKDRGLRTKSVEIKNKRGSTEMAKDWLERYPDSKLIVV